MKLTDHRLNILKILHYELNSYATGSEVVEIFFKLYGRMPGNVYEDLRDLCLMGFLVKEGKKYSATDKGKQLLSAKCGDPPTLELIYNGIVIEKVKLYDDLYKAIKEEAASDEQSIEEWAIDLFEIATKDRRAEMYKLLKKAGVTNAKP